MVKKNRNKNEESAPLISKDNGLTISYNKNQINEYFPKLITEITGNRKSVKIESIENDANSPTANRTKTKPRELVYPGAIDYIRRCSTKEEALSILDFLLQRREISDADYLTFKEEILEEEGLDRFISKHGGFKGQGYYERNYRNFTNQKKNKKEN